MALKRLFKSALVLFWAIERRVLSDKVRFGLGMNLRRAYWESRLKSLGKDVGIGAHMVVHQHREVSIGSRFSIAEFVHIWDGGGVTIGKEVLIASHVAITSMSHDPAASTFMNSSTKGKVTIGNNVWIGSGAVILPSLEIGYGSISCGRRNSHQKYYQRFKFFGMFEGTKFYLPDSEIVCA